MQTRHGSQGSNIIPIVQVRKSRFARRRQLWPAKGHAADSVCMTHTWSAWHAIRFLAWPFIVWWPGWPMPPPPFLISFTRRRRLRRKGWKLTPLTWAIKSPFSAWTKIDPEKLINLSDIELVNGRTSTSQREALFKGECLWVWGHTCVELWFSSLALLHWLKYWFFQTSVSSPLIWGGCLGKSEDRKLLMRITWVNM